MPAAKAPPPPQTDEDAYDPNGPPRGKMRELFESFGAKHSLDAEQLFFVLRDTIFKVKKDDAPFTVEEIAVAIGIADKYQLDPFVKQIYLTRSRGKLLPIVPIDGWLAIIRRQPDFDGMRVVDVFDDAGKHFAATCTIHRKDISVPMEITEYLQECKLDTEPWKQWPIRMQRHKAVIQCARYAFGISGIYDEDEAERIKRADQAREAQEVRPLASIDAPARQLPEPDPMFDVPAEVKQPAREPEPARAEAPKPAPRPAARAAKAAPAAPAAEKPAPRQSRFASPQLTPRQLTINKILDYSLKLGEPEEAEALATLTSVELEERLELWTEKYEEREAMRLEGGGR